MAAYTTPVAATLNGVNVNGFNGTGTVATSFAAIDSIVGGTAADTLSGLISGTGTCRPVRTISRACRPWRSPVSRRCNGGSGIDTFNVLTSTTADLAGNGDNDSFVFSNAAVLTGSVTGGTGTDTLSMAAYTTPVSATLSVVNANGFNGTANVVSSFAAIDAILGGSAADTLNGLTSGTWNLSASPNYVSGPGTLAFSSFQTLNGGSGVDTFNVLTSSTADLNGNGGNDEFRDLERGGVDRFGDGRYGDRHVEHGGVYDAGVGDAQWCRGERLQRVEQHGHELRGD